MRATTPAIRYVRSLLRSAGKIIPDELSYLRAWSLVSMPAIDVPDSRLSELPDGAFGAWMAAKQPKIYSIAVASDQVSVLAAGFPPFVAAVSRVTAPASPTGSGGPELVADPQAGAWLVTQSKGALATARLWELLSRDPALGN